MLLQDLLHLNLRKCEYKHHGNERSYDVHKKERLIQFFLSGNPLPPSQLRLLVHRHVRAQGIGGALLGGICAEAELRGYDAVRLEVAAANPRARALYERVGFRVVASQTIGWQRLFFECDRTLTMVRDLHGTG